MSLINRLMRLEARLAPTPLTAEQAKRRAETVEALASDYPPTVHNRIRDTLAISIECRFDFPHTETGEPWWGVVFFPWQSETPTVFHLPTPETPPPEDDEGDPRRGGASGAPLGGW